MASWTTPTALNYVTSPFNLTRRHPVTGVIRPHWGTDYRAPTGTTIRAATSGTVVRSTYSALTGHYVRINHGGGIWTGYSHLSRRDVKVGDWVSTGDHIGLSGATGAVTGAHLHFEVSVNGTKVNPVPWLASRVTRVSNPGGSTGTVPTTPGTNLPDPLEPDMPITDDDAEKIARAVHDRPVRYGTEMIDMGLAAGRAGRFSDRVLHEALPQVRTTLAAILKAVGQGEDIDESRIAQETAALVLASISEDITEVIETNQDLTAQEIAEAVVQRAGQLLTGTT